MNNFYIGIIEKS